MPGKGARRARAARSPGMLRARRLFAAHDEAERAGIPVDEVLGRAGEAAAYPARAADRRRRARRRRDAGPEPGGGARVPHRKVAGPPADRDRRRRPRRPALRAHAVDPEPRRPGRRRPCTRPTPTAPAVAAGRSGDYFAGGLITEHGGSFLNSDQTAIRRLATRLGLEQVVVNGGDLPRGDEVFFIDGRVYTYAEANADWHDVGYPAFRKAAKEMQTAAGHGAARPDVGARVARQHRDRRGQPVRQADDGRHRHRERRRPGRPVRARPDRAADRQSALVAAPAAGRRRALHDRRRQRPARLAA